MAPQGPRAAKYPGRCCDPERHHHIDRRHVTHRGSLRTDVFLLENPLDEQKTIFPHTISCNGAYLFQGRAHFVRPKASQS
jgi:hypothetical protein